MATNEVPASVADAAAEPAVGGWALASYTLVLASIVVWPAFVVWGGIWFTISDAMGLILATVTIPLIVGLDRVFAPRAPTGARVARWVGIAAMVLLGAGSLLLIAGQVDHEFQPAQGGLGVQFAGWGLWGLWLTMTGHLARRTGTFGRGVVWSGYTVGFSILVGLVGAVQGPAHPITIAGAVGMFGSLTSWTFAVRRQTA